MPRDKIEELIQQIWPEYTEESYFLIADYSEGNPGAITALTKSCKQEGEEFLDNVQEMGELRGSQIWIAFSDYCEEDIDEFVRRVNEKDKKLEEPL